MSNSDNSPLHQDEEFEIKVRELAVVLVAKAKAKKTRATSLRNDTFKFLVKLMACHRERQLSAACVKTWLVAWALALISLLYVSYS